MILINTKMIVIPELILKHRVGGRIDIRKIVKIEKGNTFQISMF